jgi:1-acyl-sn-glycerol-3-phosphate acyltransferase
LDIPLIFSFLGSVTDKNIHLFISDKFYDPLWPIAKSLEMIRIHMDKDSEQLRDDNLRQIEKGVEKLKNGNSVLIFPEGIITGGKKSQIIRGHTGVMRLAFFSGVPILPIGIRGSNIVYPYLLENKNPFYVRRSHSITIKIGKRIVVNGQQNIDLSLYSESNRRLLRDSTDKLMSQLSHLSGLPLANMYEK